MKWTAIILWFVCIIIIVFSGCSSGTATSNIAVSSNPVSTASQETVWLETEWMFHTNDKTRAQAEIPFTLIYPSYLPNYHNENELSHIKIEGPLRNSNHKDRIEVAIEYWGIPLGNSMAYNIFIRETNSYLALGDPELNPVMEYIEFKGIQITKQKDENLDDYLCFNYDGIYYVIHTINLSLSDSIKIVESMIEQAIKQPGNVQ